MRRFKLLTLLISLINLTGPLFGQEKKSERELQDYLRQRKSSTVDSIIIIKSGCTGCEMVYNDTSKSETDGQVIYVLTQENGHFQMVVFDDINKSKTLSNDTTSIFKYIDTNKEILLQKDLFYKKEIPKIISKNGFYPPSPVHYSYEILEIKLSAFSYRFEIIDNENDYLGIKRNNEKWFKVTKAIIEKFYDFLQTAKD